MIPEILSQCVMFVDGVSFSGDVPTMTPPKVTEKTEEYRGGGMSGPVDLPTGLEKLVADFTLSSASKDVMSLFSVREGAQVKFTVREAMEDFDGTVGSIVHNLTGKIIKIAQGGAKAGEVPKDKYDLSLTYYKKTINGDVVHEVDVINMVTIINGVDVLSDIRSALGM